MDFESPLRNDLVPTLPLFLDQSEQIINLLRSYPLKKLATILGVSQSIAELNHERFRNWQYKHTKANSRPALFAYHGDIYRQLRPTSYTSSQIKYASQTLRILSGLYGIVRPMDLIQPYRLEMTTTLKIGKNMSLNKFWQKAITQYLSEEIREHNHPFVLNLASIEYTRAIDFTALPVPVITVEFMEQVKGVIHNHGILTKKARGLLVQYLIEREAHTLAEVAQFNCNGYKLNSSTPDVLTFVSL